MDNLIQLTQHLLSMPTSTAISEAHAKALDAAPLRIRGVNADCVVLVASATPCDRHFEEFKEFTPDQKDRLFAALYVGCVNYPQTEEEFLGEVCSALDRVALGSIYITTTAAASSIPARDLFLALRKHRQNPQDFPASKGSIGGWTLTSYHEADGAWPVFVIVTQPGGNGTLIALQGEIPAIPVDPSRN